MGSKDCPPLPFPEHDNFREAGEKSDWTLISFMIAMAFACAMVLTAAFIYHHCARTPEQRRRRRRIGRGPENFSTSPAEGLGGSMLDALPVFVYTPENYKDGLRCAVCLCEFLLSEKGRLLPGCNHCFHVDCIDMWFYSHSTCPLCRTKVEKQSNVSLELGHSQMELSGVSQDEEEKEEDDDEEEEEETGENEVVGNDSVSSPVEQHNDNGSFSRQKDDGHSEEGREGHVAIDLGH